MFGPFRLSNVFGCFQIHARRRYQIHSTYDRVLPGRASAPVGQATDLAFTVFVGYTKRFSQGGQSIWLKVYNRRVRLQSYHLPNGTQKHCAPWSKGTISIIDVIICSYSKTMSPKASTAPTRKYSKPLFFQCLVNNPHYQYHVQHRQNQFMLVRVRFELVLASHRFLDSTSLRSHSSRWTIFLALIYTSISQIIIWWYEDLFEPTRWM